jgi:hypothetical protein
MKRNLTFTTILLLLVASTLPTLANQTADSLIIQFANRTKMVIYAPNREGIKALSKYDLNKMVRDMGMRLDSVPNGQTTISIDSKDGGRYLRDTVLIITRGKEGNRGKNSDVRIIFRGDDKSDKDTSRSEREYKLESDRKKKGSNSDWRVKTDFLIGLNTLVAPTTSSAYDPSRYELRPVGSRFFGISFGQRPTLVKGKNARLSLHYGLEVNWNNFMFDNKVTVTKGPNQINFTDIQQQSEKSKLTIANLQLPVVPRVTFYNHDGKRVAHLGIGGYVGYRIDSYTMIKYSRSEKVRDHDRYFQNDLRYGLMAHLGILRTNFFVKYDLNPIFQTSKGPDVRALSFGIIL